MRISEAIERVVGARTREELIDAVTAGVTEVARSDGVRVAKIRKAPSVAYQVVGRDGPAPDPSPSIARSPLSSPLVEEHVRTGFGGWVSMEDLLPGRAWTSHPLYLEAYRPLGLRAQISCALRVSGQVTYSLSLNRAGRDFGQGERDLLEQYRRLVHSSWLRVEELEAARAALALLREEREDDAMVVLTPDPVTPQIVYCTEAMQRLARGQPQLWELIQQTVAATEPAGERRASRTSSAVRLEALHTGNAVVVHVVPASFPELTHRERQILAALADGRTAHAIGHQLGISEGTVRKHLEHIYEKTGQRDRLLVVSYAQRRGLLPAS